MAAALTVGCVPADAPEAGEEAREAVRRLRLDTVPAVLIGRGRSEAAHQLHRVVGARRLDDGRVVVADGGSSEIRYFSAAGDHLLTAGSEGEGPGELAGILALALADGESVAVLDYRSGLTVFGGRGEVVREERIAPSGLGTGMPCRLAEDWRLLPDLSLLGVFEDNPSPPGCGPPPEGIWRMSALLARFGPGGGGRAGPGPDTLAVVPGTERNGPDYRVFGRTLALAVSGEWLFYADTGGDSIRSLRWAGGGRPDGSRSGRASRVGSASPAPGGSAGTDSIRELSFPIPFEARPVPAAARRHEARRMSGRPYDFPDGLPRIGRLLAGTDGLLWVAAYPEADMPISSWTTQRALAPLGHRWPLRWKGLDEDGNVVAELSTPPRFFPFEIGSDHVLGLRWSEMDVETVELYRLVEVSASSQAPRGPGGSEGTR